MEVGNPKESMQQPLQKELFIDLSKMDEISDDEYKQISAPPQTINKTATTQLQAGQKNIEKVMPQAFDGELKNAKHKLPDEAALKKNGHYKVDTKEGSASLMMTDTQNQPAQKRLASSAGNTGVFENIDNEANIDSINFALHTLFNISGNYLKAKMDSWVNGSAKPHDLTLTLRASYELHEVTNAAEKMVINWVSSHYKDHMDYANYIKFNLIKINPTRAVIPRQAEDLESEGMHAKRSIDKTDNIVIYSAFTKDDIGYTQKIHGAKKLILSASSDDNTLFYSRKIETLANGIHFLNDKNEFETISSLEDAQKMIKGIKGISKVRSEELLDIVGHYFKDNSMTIDLNEAEKVEEQKDKSKDLKDSKDSRDSKDSGDLKDSKDLKDSEDK